VTDISGDGQIYVRVHVSIHTPVWGVTIRIANQNAGGSSFNPHPRMGGDPEEARKRGLAVIVSIHTPVWGVTYTIHNLFRQHRVSIHTPVWGGDRI